MSGRRWSSFARAAAVVAVLAVPLAGPLPATAAVRTGYERAVRITFPVRGDVSYANTYDAPRSGGRIHQATDIMGAKMQRIHAAKGGTVCHITGVGEKMPSYGYMITICGKDGLRYSYLHINNDRPGTDDGKGGVRYAYAKGLQAGAEVVRGQLLGYLGDSGNAEATAPHLHFEIADPELDDARIDRGAYDRLRLNPYFSLRRAEARGDYPGARYPERTPQAGP